MNTKKIDAYAKTATKLAARGGDWRRSEECVGLATHCSCCGHKLVDAHSVNVAIGPDCRKAIGFDQNYVPISPDWEAARTIAVNNGVADSAVDDWRDARVVCNFFTHVYALAAEANPWIPDAVFALGYEALSKRLGERRAEFIARQEKLEAKAREEARKREEKAKARARARGRVFTAPVEVAPEVRVTEEGDILVVNTPYHAGFNASLRETIPSRRWDSAAKAWRVPAAARPDLWRALRGFFAGATLISWTGTSTIPALDA
jgi:hypothetical protein